MSDDPGAGGARHYTKWWEKFALKKLAHFSYLNGARRRVSSHPRTKGKNIVYTVLENLYF